MKKLLVIFLLALIGLEVVLLLPRPEPKKSQEISIPQISESDKLFSLVNKWRINQNLPPYTIDKRLCDFAKIRLSELPNDYSHKGLWNRVNSNQVGFSYRELGENLIKDYNDNYTAIRSWSHSPGHLKNLKFPYKYSCVASDSTYAVQIFANF